MNNENYDNDYEQVFIVSDKEEFDDYSKNSSSNSNSASCDNSDSDSYKNATKVGHSFLSLGMAFVAIIVCLAITLKSISSVLGFNITFPIVMLIVIVLLIAIALSLALTAYEDSDDEIDEESTNIVSKRCRSVKDIEYEPRKKFNNIREYEQSAEFKMDEAEKAQKARDDIELAVEALVRLGYGKRKAADWVNRAVSSGIATGDTQGILRYALTRGTA